MTVTSDALGAAAVVVEGAGDELLAGAALAGDQHGALGVGDLVDDVEHVRAGLALLPMMLSKS